MCLGIPGQIVEFIDEEKFFAKVDVSGVKRDINMAMLQADEVKPGDWVLIHVGFAMSIIDESEAHATLTLLRQMDQAYEDEMELIRQGQSE
jgi:hydrogenase expression/formation protein HypC